LLLPPLLPSPPSPSPPPIGPRRQNRTSALQSALNRPRFRQERIAVRCETAAQDPSLDSHSSDEEEGFGGMVSPVHAPGTRVVGRHSSADESVPAMHAPGTRVIGRHGSGARSSVESSPAAAATAVPPIHSPGSRSVGRHSRVVQPEHAVVTAPHADRPRSASGDTPGVAAAAAVRQPVLRASQDRCAPQDASVPPPRNLSLCAAPPTPKPSATVAAAVAAAIPTALLLWLLLPSPPPPCLVLFPALPRRLVGMFE